MIIELSSYRKSIYSIIRDNSKIGIIDFKEINYYLKDSKCKITKDEELYIDTSDKIIEIISDINKDKVKSYQEVEKILKTLDLGEIHLIINELQNKFSISMLTYKVKNIFKSLFYKTDDIDILKLSIIITGLFFDADLIKGYVLVGQYSEFSIYVANVFAAHWKSKFYRKGCITLIHSSRGVARLKLIRQLLKDSSVSEDVDFINVTSE